ncbi:hypothetical protein R70723_03355 [Paenibacillus sp. FSL R7-0273]|nr:hypothetical protein R70723_03355 [Paenibacillus sp. FSL R7-0273]OMF88639.1 hypothetical protein BK144_20985 [Paenibacillus sp. FSL R7-0273]
MGFDSPIALGAIIGIVLDFHRATTEQDLSKETKGQNPRRLIQHTAEGLCNPWIPVVRQQERLGKDRRI